MICRKCQEEGKTSQVQSLGGSTTLMGWKPYYDEQGKFHNHNPNTERMVYRCSNGHTWDIVRKPPCSNKECPLHEDKRE